MTELDRPLDGPLVSVVVPCYRAAPFLRDALDSVVAQGTGALEVLVVDDGSPDGPELQAIVEDYAGSPCPVRLLVRPHRGLAATRNAGIAAAQAPWVAFLDADDCWLPGFVEAQVDLLESSGADAVYCDAEFFGGSDKDGASVMHWHPSTAEVTLESVLAGTAVPVMSTIVARTSAVREAGGFDPEVDFGEDFELWARMLAAGARFAWSPEVRARRRLHDGNMSRNTLGMARGQIEIIHRHAEQLAPDGHWPAAIARRLPWWATHGHC